MEKLKQIKNLLKKAIKNVTSVFYAADIIIKILLNKARSYCMKKTRSFISFILNWKINIYCTKMMMVQKREFLSILPLLNKEKILIIHLPCIPSKHPLTLLMLTLQVFVFSLNLQLIQNIVY